MTDLAPLFRTINGGSGAGVAADKMVDTVTAVSGLFGQLGFAFKDSTGKAILPQLDSLGRIPVYTANGTLVNSGLGELAAGSLTEVAITNAEVTLVASAVYTDFSINISCRQDSLFNLYKSDNAVETILEQFILGPGQYTLVTPLQNRTHTAGATGVQKLLFKGMNFETLSSLRATFSCRKVS